MKNDKFVTFVKELTKNNPTLEESILEGYKSIFEADDAIEEGLRETISAGLLAAGLAASPAAAKDPNIDLYGNSRKEFVQKDEIKEVMHEIGHIEKDVMKQIRKELVQKMDPEEVTESIEYAKAKYNEIKEKFGENKALDYLRYINFELLNLDVGFPKIKI